MKMIFSLTGITITLQTFGIDMYSSHRNDFSCNTSLFISVDIKFTNLQKAMCLNDKSFIYAWILMYIFWI